MKYTDTYNYGNNRKKGWNIKWLLPLLVLIICGALLCAVMKKAYASGREQIRMKAEMNAVTYADRMAACLDDGIDITELSSSLLMTIQRTQFGGHLTNTRMITTRLHRKPGQQLRISPLRSFLIRDFSL